MREDSGSREYTFSTCCVRLVIIITLVIFTMAIKAASASAEGDGPLVDVNSPEEGLWTNNANVHVTGTAVNASYLTVLVQSPRGEYNTTGELSPEGEFNITVELWVGWNRVTVYVSVNPIPDLMSGNMTNVTIVTRTVIVDLTPPLLEIRYPKDWPTYTRESRILITGYYDMDPNNPANKERGMFHRDVPLLVGENMIDIRFVDEAGNEAVEWVYVIADWTLPTVFIEKPWPDPYITNNPTIEFRGRAGMGTTMLKLIHNDVEYNITAIDGDLDICATWQYVLELGPTDLEQVVTVRARDIAWNVAEDNVTVILDLVPPTIDLAYLPNATRVLNVIIDGRVDEDGIGAIEVNGALYPVVDRRFNIHWPLKIGFNEFALVVIDRAGNRGMAEARVFHSIDPPLLEVHEVKDLGDDNYLVRGACSNYIANVTIDGTDYPVVDSEFWEEIEVASGTDRILVSVEDPAGNTAQEWVDLGIPTVVWYLAIVVIIVAIVGLVFAIVTMRGSKDAGRQP